MTFSRPRRTLSLACCLAVLVLFVGAGCADKGEAPVDGGGAPPSSPGGAPAAGGASGGPAVFAQNCSGCHGPSGEGGSGPALKAAAGLADADIKGIIETGKGRMPSFAGKVAADQLDGLVAHVKSLAK